MPQHMREFSFLRLLHSFRSFHFSTLFCGQQWSASMRTKQKSLIKCQKQRDNHWWNDGIMERWSCIRMCNRAQACFGLAYFHWVEHLNTGRTVHIRVYKVFGSEMFILNAFRTNNNLNKVNKFFFWFGCNLYDFSFCVTKRKSTFILFLWFTFEY